MKTCYSPLSLFAIGFGITFLLSLMWVIGVAYECWSCWDGGWRWIKNSLTYGLAHHLFFPAAVGLFLAAHRREVRKCFRMGSVVVLVLLVCLAARISYQDFTQGYLAPYQMKDACGCLKIEESLRSTSHKLPAEKAAVQEGIKSLPPQQQGEDNQLTARRKSLYAELDDLRDKNNRLAKEKETFNDQREKKSWSDAVTIGNKTSIITGVLTWVYITLMAVLLWYCWSVVWYKPAVRNSLSGHAPAQEAFEDLRLKLATAVVLAFLWVPCRIYADWYECDWASLELGPRNVKVVFAAIMALLVLGFLLVDRILAFPGYREFYVLVAGVTVTVVSFLLLHYRVWFVPLNDVLNQLTVDMAISLLIVPGILVVGLVRNAF